MHHSMQRCTLKTTLIARSPRCSLLWHLDLLVLRWETNAWYSNRYTKTHRNIHLLRDQALNDHRYLLHTRLKYLESPACPVHSRNILHAVHFILDGYPAVVLALRRRSGCCIENREHVISEGICVPEVYFHRLTCDRESI